MADASPWRTIGSAPSTPTSGRLAAVAARSRPRARPGRRLPGWAAAARGCRAAGADQVIQTVVELVEALDVVHDPLVGAQRAGHQRLRGPLVHLDQPPVPQRPLRGQSVPGRFGQDAERQGECGLAGPRLAGGWLRSRAAIAGSNSMAAHSSRMRRSKRDRPRRSPSSSSAGGGPGSRPGRSLRSTRRLPGRRSRRVAAG